MSEREAERVARISKWLGTNLEPHTATMVMGAKREPESNTAAIAQGSLSD